MTPVPGAASPRPPGGAAWQTRPSDPPSFRVQQCTFGILLAAVGALLLVLLATGLAPTLRLPLLAQLVVTLVATGVARGGLATPGALVTCLALLTLPWWPGVKADIEALGLGALTGAVGAVLVASGTLGARSAGAVALAAITSTASLGLVVPLPPGLRAALPLGINTVALAALGVHLLVRREIDRIQRIASRSEALLDEMHLAAEGAHEGLWHWDVDAGVLHLSARAEDLLGLPHRGTHPAAGWLAGVADADAARVDAAFADFIAQERPLLELRFRLRDSGDGPERWALIRAAAAREGGRARRLAGSVADVTTWTRNEARLRETVYRDPLTGLPNRILLLDRMRHAFARAGERQDVRFAALFLDLDGFKLVNDSLGHRIGDQMLVEVARRLERAVRPTDTVSRLGGDEFLIFLESLPSTEEAENVASRILARLRPAIAVAGHQLHTTASIGVAVGPAQYSGPEELIRDADTAMYGAKAEGKGRYRLFDARMRQRVVARLSLEQELKVAVENRELRLAYQPIVDLRSGGILGFEALLRWPREDRPPVGPAEFIPIAEATGLILPISWWVIETAAAAVARWRAAVPGASAAWVQVNINADLLRQPDLVGSIRTVVEHNGLGPAALRFEITESGVMDPGEEVCQVLERLRAAGFEVHLDDFGTGYSSLSYLFRYPVDGLKIDRAFIRQLEDARHPGLVESILQIARSFGLSVTAEGVETAQQLGILRTLGCPRGQGYLFSPAVFDAQAEALLRGPLPWRDHFADPPRPALVPAG